MRSRAKIDAKLVFFCKLACKVVFVEILSRQLLFFTAMKFHATEQPSEYTTLVIYGVILLVAVHVLALVSFI